MFSVSQWFHHFFLRFFILYLYSQQSRIAFCSDISLQAFWPICLYISSIELRIFVFGDPGDSPLFVFRLIGADGSVSRLLTVITWLNATTEITESPTWCNQKQQWYSEYLQRLLFYSMKAIEKISSCWLFMFNTNNLSWYTCIITILILSHSVIKILLLESVISFN